MHVFARRSGRSRLRHETDRKYADGQRVQQRTGTRCTEFWRRHAFGHHDRNSGSRDRCDGQRLANLPEPELPNVGTLGLLSAGRRVWFSRSASGFGGADLPPARYYPSADSAPRQPAVCRRRCVALVASRHRLRVADAILRRPAVAAMCRGRVCAATRATQRFSTKKCRSSPRRRWQPGSRKPILRPEPAGVSASLYEHCCRALDRGLTSGPHGLPLIGCGDWNDGFSRVGRQGKGESVWLGFFIDYVLQRMLPICSERGDRSACRALYRLPRTTCRTRSTRPAGTARGIAAPTTTMASRIGSAASDECQIDALAQAWAVISGVAPPDRAEMAMQRG